MSKILLVEDDTALAGMIVDWLEAERFMTEHVDSGKEGLNRLKFYQYDAIIADWDLPDLSGIDMVKSFRNNGGVTPVLMLTGKNKIDEKEAGFTAGADDYLTKPFHMRELTMRIRALLRRPQAVTASTLCVDNLKLDPTAFKVSRAEVPIDLNPKEFALLEFMMKHPNQVFTPEALLDRLWSSDAESSVDAVRQCMKRLRKKIDLDGHRQIISTVYGVGYRLDQ